MFVCKNFFLSGGEISTLWIYFYHSWQNIISTQTIAPFPKLSKYILFEALYYFPWIKNGFLSFFYFLASTSTTILLDAMVQTLIFCLFVSLNTLCCLSLLYQVKSLDLESSKLASSRLILLISTLILFYHLEMWHYQNLHQKRVYHHLWIKHQKCFNHFICNKPIRNKF